MEWTDDGVVLGARKHGESSAIVELLTQGHGRHLGLVRGGGASRLRPVLQPGNEVRATWRARLDEHLGQFTVEPIRQRDGWQGGGAAVAYGLTHAAALCRLLPERDPHPELHDDLIHLLDALEGQGGAAWMVRFELAVLSELGFRLDLSCCASSGRLDDLIYVSPRSGRAVSRDAGEPWRDRLLALPAFATDPDVSDISDRDLADGFRLSHYFLMRHVLEPRGLTFTEARERFVAAVLARDAA